MAKSKIIIVDPLWKMSFPEGNRRFYSMWLTDDKNMIKPLANSSDTELVLNFNDKKDTRSKYSKDSSWQNVNFYLRKFLDNGNPICSFTFNQPITSKTAFQDIYFYNDTAIDDNKECKLSWNGSFKVARFKNCYYTNIELVNNNRQHDLSSSTLNALHIENAIKLKELKVSGLNNKLRIDAIVAPKLEKIIIKDFDRLVLSINLFGWQDNLVIPKLKEVDLSTINKIFVDPSTLFSTWNIDFSGDKRQGLFNYEKIKNKYKENLEEFTKALNKKININTKIKLNPNSYIYLSDDPWFNEDVQEAATRKYTTKKYQVKDLFNCENEKEVTVEVKDFYNKYLEMIEDKYIKMFKMFKQDFNEITKKAKSQNVINKDDKLIK